MYLVLNRMRRIIQRRFNMHAIKDGTAQRTDRQFATHPLYHVPGTISCRLVNIARSEGWKH